MLLRKVFFALYGLYLLLYGILNMRIFGISLGTIIMVLIVALVVRKFGSAIPLLNQVPAG